MTVQGPVKEQQPDGMSHGGGGLATIEWSSDSDVATKRHNPYKSQQQIFADVSVTLPIQCYLKMHSNK